MDKKARELFLRQPDTGVFSTVDGQGHPHSVPVWFRWDGDCARVVTARDSVKVRHLRDTPRASLCVDRRQGMMRYVSIEGPVEIVDPLTLDERLALRAHYQGEEEARAIVEKGGHEQMVLLKLKPEKWITMG
jgi:PPOX class probable F420-dependent enzyme